MPLVPELQTDRLILRPHRRQDFDSSAALWGDEEVLTYFSTSAFSKEASWSRLLRYAGHWQMMGYGYWVVEHRDTREFLGEVGFADYKRDISPSFEGRPEAGWVFTVAAQGKGYAEEAVRSMLVWADASLDSKDTVAMINPEHSASIRLARAVGYGDPGKTIYNGSDVLVYSRARQAMHPLQNPC